METSSTHPFRKSSSPSWQGIAHGLELLKKGTIWRVESGCKVQIWRDNWIPRDNSLKITRKVGRCRLRWVSDLLLPNSRRWNEQLIRMIFFPHDAEAILSLRLLPVEGEDLIAWHYEKAGIFSVRSAYRLGLREQYFASASGQSSAAPMVIGRYGI